jgi:hypothetical protein
MSLLFKPRETRQKVVLPARMRAGAGQVDVCIRDVSSRGMLIQAGVPPPRGTYVEILRPGYSVTGRVVWSKHHKFGIQSREKIRIAAVLERRSLPRPGGGEPPLNQSGGQVRLSPRLDPAQQAAQARARAAFLQYAALGGAVTLAALLLALSLFRGLSNTFADVVSHLH